jgi:hypothetical protein
MVQNQAGLTLVLQAEDFFRELVTEALGRRNYGTQIEYYLVNLLHQFMLAEKLHAPSQAGGGSLVSMLKQALEKTDTKSRSAAFRHLGDVALYVAGFFQDSLNRKLVDVDYYIDMGKMAYRQVSVHSEEENLRQLYQELAEGFGSFVDVLAEVSERTSHRNEQDLLRTYEIWLRTRSERAAKTLQEAGILPNQTLKRGLQ